MPEVQDKMIEPLPSTDWRDFTNKLVTAFSMDFARSLARALFQDPELFHDNKQYLTKAQELSDTDKDLLRDFYFINGQCHALALAIHRLTGWQLACMGWVSWCNLPKHVFVTLPDGRGLDIFGLFTCGENSEAPHPVHDVRDITDWKSINEEELMSYIDREKHPDIFYWTMNEPFAQEQAPILLAKLGLLPADTDKINRTSTEAHALVGGRR